MCVGDTLVQEGSLSLSHDEGGVEGDLESWVVEKVELQCPGVLSLNPGSPPSLSHARTFAGRVPGRRRVNEYSPYQSSHVPTGPGRPDPSRSSPRGLRPGAER